MLLKDQQIEALRKEVATLQQQQEQRQQQEKQHNWTDIIDHDRNLQNQSASHSNNNVPFHQIGFDVIPIPTTTTQHVYPTLAQYTPQSSMFVPKAAVESFHQSQSHGQTQSVGRDGTSGIMTLFSPLRDYQPETRSREVMDKICCICNEESFGLTVSALYY